MWRTVLYILKDPTCFEYGEIYTEYVAVEEKPAHVLDLCCNIYNML